MKEKFTTFARAQGFTEDTIVFLPKNGEGAANRIGKRLGQLVADRLPIQGGPGTTCPLTSVWPPEGSNLSSPHDLGL